MCAIPLCTSIVRTHITHTHTHAADTRTHACTHQHALTQTKHALLFVHRSFFAQLLLFCLYYSSKIYSQSGSCSGILIESTTCLLKSLQTLPNVCLWRFMIPLAPHLFVVFSYNFVIDVVFLVCPLCYEAIKNASNMRTHMMNAHPKELPQCETPEEWQKMCALMEQRTPKQYYCVHCINSTGMYCCACASKSVCGDLSSY